MLLIAKLNSKKSLEIMEGKTLKSRINKPFFEGCKQPQKASVGSRKAKVRDLLFLLVIFYISKLSLFYFDSQKHGQDILYEITQLFQQELRKH